MPIPTDVAALVLFKADRKCCVCRAENKPIQIHHIDGDKQNNRIENLSVLCLDCHTDTQIHGGFHRKLTPELVTLYRDNWNTIVEKERLTAMVTLYKEPASIKNMEIITSIIEDLTERKEYVLLAMFYHNVGNKELRDKYTGIALSKKQDADTVIFLRALQGNISLVSPEVIEKEVQRLENTKDWTQLGRLYVDIEKWSEAVKSYCTGITNSLDKNNWFSAAFYLKELWREKLYEKLFQKALKSAADKGDIWWQVRALEELGWDTELQALLKAHEEEIRKSGDPILQSLLFKGLKDEDNYAKAMKNIYKETKMVTIAGDKNT